MGRWTICGSAPRTHQEHEDKLLQRHRCGDRADALIVIGGSHHRHSREIAEWEEDHHLTGELDELGVAKADALADRPQREPPGDAVEEIHRDDHRNHEQRNLPLDLAEDMAEARRVDTDDKRRETGGGKEFGPKSAQDLAGGSEDRHRSLMLPAMPLSEPGRLRPPSGGRHRPIESTDGHAAASARPD